MYYLKSHIITGLTKTKSKLLVIFPCTYWRFGQKVKLRKNTPFKFTTYTIQKCNTTQLNRLYKWVCIHHLRYHLKDWLFVFPLILYLLWLLCRMLQNWTTNQSMIPICLWDYIHDVRYHLKAYLFFFQLIQYIICYDCLLGTRAKWLAYIRRNKKKNNVPKLHHYLKFIIMFCFGGFRYKEWAVGTRE